MPTCPDVVPDDLELPAEWPGVVCELSTSLAPLEALSRLRPLGKSILLHSAQTGFSQNQSPSLGRYSFLMADPFDWIVADGVDTNKLFNVRERLAKFSERSIDNLPPFQGGAAGFLAYDFNRALENIPRPRYVDFPIPVLAIGLYDVVVAWDHQLNRAWVISQGFPETEWGSRRQRALQRVESFSTRLESVKPDWRRDRFESKIEDDEENDADSFHSVPARAIYSPHTCLGYPNVTSNLSHAQYKSVVERGIKYIYEGDIYQVNLAQRLLVPTNVESLELYRRLATVNPAPFAGWFDLGNVQILSCSPERLAVLRGRRVETRPIKGTRKRTGFPEVDLVRKMELLSSGKDRSENVMIVDLMRNDLSRVCADDSVRVRQLMEVEAYQSVMHLVSAVEGELREGMDAIDLLTAIFPGGSITGAPKIRAMEIISELEPTARGAYCGSLGYIGFSGMADFNILIRTITAMQGYLQIPVGGGIVAQSDVGEEYEETWTKASAMLQAICRHC